MKETLANRVGRIISGSLNAIVDTLENAAPETVMEEAIREIDSVIDDVRAELGRIIANKHLASRRLLEENRKHEDLAEKIELAVSEGRDDLAEAAIAKQLDIEAQIPLLEGAIADAGEKERELEGYISALQARQREMRDELRQFRASREEVAAGNTSGSAAAGAGHDTRAEKASASFDRVLEKATDLSARSGHTDAQSAARLAELEELARTNRIRERLAAVKEANKT